MQHRETRRSLSLKKLLLLIVSIILILELTAGLFSIKLWRGYALQERFETINREHSRIATAIVAKDSMFKSLMDTISYLYSIRDVLKEKSRYDADVDDSMFLRILYAYSNLDECIDSVALISDDKSENYVYQYYSQIGNYKRMLQAAIDAHGYSDWTQLSGERMFTISVPFYVTQDVKKDDFSIKSGLPQGSCVFFIDLDAYLQQIGLNNDAGDMRFVLTNAEGKILSDAQHIPDGVREHIVRLAQSPSQGGELRETMTIDGGGYAFYGSTLEDIGWKLIGYAPMSYSGANRTVFFSIVAIWASMAVMTILLVALVLISLYRFIAHLLKHMKYMQQGIWNRPMKRGRLKEFIEISESFDHMMAQISLLHNQNMHIQRRFLEQEIQKRQIMLKSLQAQINPHFLYNTLECVKSIGVYYEINEIRIIAQSLAYMFRYSIKGSAIVAVREEIECVQNYMAIQNIRFDSRFHFEMQIDEEMNEIRVPKMILQPLVENSIIHGLEKKGGQGHIWLWVHADPQQQICVTVQDDGQGIPSEQIRALEAQFAQPDGMENDSHSSIGLANIRQRLYLYYEDDAEMTIESEAGRGTIIRIKMPMHKEELDVQSHGG